MTQNQNWIHRVCKQNRYYNGIKQEQDVDAASKRPSRGGIQHRCAFRNQTTSRHRLSSVIYETNYEYTSDTQCEAYNTCLFIRRKYLNVTRE